MSLYTQPTILIPLHEFKHEDNLPILRKDERKWVILNDDFGFEVGSMGSGYWVRVPQQFITDLASVPKFLWSFIPPHGLHLSAAIIHDFLYSGASGLGLNRRIADAIFLDAMKVSNVKWARRHLMWMAVRAFGWIRYKEDGSKSKEDITYDQYFSVS